MDVKELAELVKEMRNAQRLYFRTKSPVVLKQSKALEKRVDCAVSDSLADSGQRRLFQES